MSKLGNLLWYEGGTVLIAAPVQINDKMIFFKRNFQLPTNTI